MKQIPDDIATIYKTPMYFHGIHLTDYTNIAIYLKKNDNDYFIWYLDQNQICRKTTIRTLNRQRIKLKNLHQTWYACWLTDEYPPYYPINMDRNLVLDRNILRHLKEGEHISRLTELAGTIYLKRSEFQGYSDFERLFQKIQKPVIMTEDNCFQYAKIYVNCSISVTIEDIKKHKKELDKWALNTLENHSSFKKLQLPITALALGNLVLTRDKRLEYTFEIKKELRELLL